LKDFLLNQLIANNKKSFVYDPDKDEVQQYFERVENRQIKRLTNKVFREPKQKKLFLKVFAKMRKKMRRGNQFDVALELKKHFVQAQKDNLFNDLYLFSNNQTQNPITGLLVAKSDHELLEEHKRHKILVDELHQKRCIFLDKIGFNQNFINEVFSFDDVLQLYFQTATPAAIVQMKKRLSTKYKTKVKIKFF
jgi:hypothetical protein